MTKRKFRGRPMSVITNAVPRAAPSVWPMPGHRTMAEVDAEDTPIVDPPAAIWVRRVRQRCQNCRAGRKCYAAHAV